MAKKGDRVRALLVTMAMGAMLLSMLPAAHADHEVTTARIAGNDRFDTAAHLAELSYPEGTAQAIIARADGFADALAAAPLAALLGAPVLLTNTDEIPARTLRALRDLGVAQVWVLGGEQAVSASVEQRLIDDNYEVQRIAGRSRFATAAFIASYLSAEGAVGELEERRTAFVVSGTSFADALAAGPLSSAQLLPILLTGQDALPEETARALDEADIERVVIAGGTASVSAGVAALLEQNGYEVQRVSGPSRTATAEALANYGIRVAGLSPVGAMLARGDAFPDALAAGPFAGEVGAPILLTAAPTVVGPETRRWFSQRCPAVELIQAIGGASAVHPDVLSATANAARECHDPAADQTFMMNPDEPVVVAPGQDAEITVPGRHDNTPFTGPVDLAIFPCDSVDTSGSPVIFSDADSNFQADRIRQSNTGNAVMATLNDLTMNARYIANAGPGADGVMRVTLSSETADCLVLAVFEPSRDEYYQIDLNEQGRPVIPFGVVQVAWSG